MAAAARLAASPGARRAASAAALAGGALLVLAPGELAPVAARAALVAGALFAIAALARPLARTARRTEQLSVVARAPLAQGAGIALVEADGRRLLVGFGRDGARLIARLGDRARRAEGDEP